MRTASQYGTVNSGVSSRCREPHRGEPTRCSLLRAANRLIGRDEALRRLAP